MSKVTIDEFLIEMGFDPAKVFKGLERLDKQVMKVATRLEQKMTKAFSKDFTKGAQQSLKNLEKVSANVGRNIQRNLNKAGDVRLNSRNIFGGLVSDAEKAASRANRALSRIRGPRLGGAGGGTGQGAGGAGRPPRQGSPRPGSLSEAQRLNQRFNNSAAMIRLENGRGQNSIAARQFQSRAAMITARHAGNSDALRREFARLTVQLREHESAVRRDSRATEAHERAQQREAARANRQARQSRQTRTDTARGTTAGVLAGNAITFVAQKAVEVAKEAYTQGVERSQAKTMAGAAFGKDSEQMQKGVAELANKYGQNQTDLLREISVQRNTMPREKFSNEQLLKNFETMSVFSHATGVSNESVGRANYAIGQIAGSAKINKQDINQLTNAVPEALSVTAKAMGKSKEWLIKNMKDIKPEVFLENFYKGMQQFNEKTGAATTAQHSIQAQQGRLMNAWNNDLIALFNGTGDGVGGLFETLTGLLIKAEPAFRLVGEAIQEALKWLDGYYAKLGELGDAFKRLFDSFSPETQETLRKTAKVLGEIFGFLVTAPFEGLKAAIQTLIDFIDLLTGKKKDTSETVEGSTVRKKGGILDLQAWNPFNSDANGELVEGSSWRRKGGMFDFSTHSGSNLVENDPTMYGTAYNPSRDYLKDSALQSANPFGVGSVKGNFSVEPLKVDMPTQITIKLDQDTLIPLIRQQSLSVFNDKQESQMMAADGLGGNGWKTGGLNAGYFPSKLW